MLQSFMEITSVDKYVENITFLALIQIQEHTWQGVRPIVGVFEMSVE